MVEEFLGISMTLAEFPVLKSIRGIGMSDAPELEERLAEKLDYTNTFYHQAPLLDITNPDPKDFGRYDFILSSEVMEHVPPPIEDAFATLYQLLKPGGLLFLTTPFSLNEKTVEHFPELREFTLASLNGTAVLVNRRGDGSIEVFEDLMFHGGPGSTVEMRLFSEKALREMMTAAGFTSIRVAADHWPEYGVEQSHQWSLPIVARKGEFRVSTAELAREYRKARRLATHLEEQLAKLQKDYDQFIAHHDASHEEMKKKLAEQFEWGSKLDRDFIERTKWAQGLDLEIADLRRALGEAREKQARMESARWTRMGRRFGAIE
jgi:SAM-dependent methyltransferase